jgi:hypothetical protein
LALIFLFLAVYHNPIATGYLSGDNRVDKPRNCNMSKIEDQGQLQEDAVNHPERGKVDGRLVLNESTEKIEITVNRETYKRLTLNAAAEGEAIATAAARLLKTGLATSDERGKVRDFLELKAAMLGITVAEAAAKIFGLKKQQARDRKRKSI